MAVRTAGTAHVSVQPDVLTPSHITAITPAAAEPTLDVVPCTRSVDVPPPLLACTIDEPLPDIEDIEGIDASLPAKIAHITATASATAETIALSGRSAVPEADDANTHTP